MLGVKTYFYVAHIVEVVKYFLEGTLKFQPRCWNYRLVIFVGNDVEYLEVISCICWVQVQYAPGDSAYCVFAIFVL